jgi:Zn-dependent metalloprotease
MNEAFSDMAAQAAEFYAYGGKNTWLIGSEVLKAEDDALRYMKKPSLDCNGGRPGLYCSINDASQYQEWQNVHWTSGVYNRAFYLLATTKGWDVKKAFDVMVQANRFYWVPKSTFKQGACGVIKAAKDYKYSVKDVRDAFKKVKISC